MISEQYIRSNLDNLWNEVKTYRGSENYYQLLQVCRHFRELAPYNAMLVNMQRPSALYVLRASEWKSRFNRLIKPNARPIIILVPFGPVDFLFEINDTYADTTNNMFSPKDEEIIKQLSAPYETKREVSREMLRLIENQAAFHSVAFDNNFVAGNVYAGNIRLLDKHSHLLSIPINKNIYITHYADYLISINSKAGNGERFASICHELGHLFLQHISQPPKWKDRPLRHISEVTKEFEAESVSWLICEKLNIGNPSEKYLADYYAANNEIPKDVSIEAIFKAVNAVWQLCTTPQMNIRDGLLYKNNSDFKKDVDNLVKLNKTTIYQPQIPNGQLQIPL